MDNHTNREQEIKSCSLSLCKCLKITRGFCMFFGAIFKVVTRWVYVFFKISEKIFCGYVYMLFSMYHGKLRKILKHSRFVGYTTQNIPTAYHICNIIIFYQQGVLHLHTAGLVCPVLVWKYSVALPAHPC